MAACRSLKRRPRQLPKRPQRGCSIQLLWCGAGWQHMSIVRDTRWMTIFILSFLHQKRSIAETESVKVLQDVYNKWQQSKRGRKEKENYAGRGNSPCINKKKGHIGSEGL
eukprot:1154999-Pelagomonas_calceolata.AAC.4